METKYYLSSEDNSVRGKVFKRDDSLIEVDFSTLNPMGYAGTWLFSNEKDAFEKVRWVLEKGNGKYKEA
jgi:hypothetical protein